jgi:hypothetical protein
MNITWAQCSSCTHHHPERTDKDKIFGDCELFYTDKFPKMSMDPNKGAVCEDYTKNNIRKD